MLNVKLYFFNRVVIGLFIALIGSVISSNFAISSELKQNSVNASIDEWLDPALKDRKRLVVEVLRDFGDTATIENPVLPGDVSFGYSFKPQTAFDLGCLNCIRQFIGNSKERLPVVDLGCGQGALSVLAVLAGARVDLVDFKEIVELANKRMFTQTKKVIGYEAKDVKNYYRAFPQSLTSVENPSWTNTKHKLAICRDVIHHFTEEDIKIFAKRVYDNVEDEGVFSIHAESPYGNKRILAYHDARVGKTLCPGLAIYCKKRSVGGLDVVNDPVPYQEGCDYKPGCFYYGRILEDGQIVDEEDYYRNVRNFFTIEDLITIFEAVGFKALNTYYMDYQCRVLDGGELPKAGQVSKACAIFIKRKI